MSNAVKKASDSDHSHLEMEYQSLRAEILKRMDLRQQMVSVTLTIAGAFLGFGLGTPAVALVYPPLAAFLAVAWAQNDYRVRQVSTYIREHHETQLAGLGWETHMQAQRSSGGVGAWRLLLMSHGGIFLLTQWMAIGIGLLKFTYAPVEYALLVVDVLFVVIVIWVLAQLK